MENWKLGYEMWVNDRVARHPVVLIALKRERCSLRRRHSTPPV